MGTLLTWGLVRCTMPGREAVLTIWVTCFWTCVCLVFGSLSVADMTTRQRIHHRELLQLNSRAVVIGMIVIVWFLRACDNL